MRNLLKKIRSGLEDEGNRKEVLNSCIDVRVSEAHPQDLITLQRRRVKKVEPLTTPL